MSNTNEKCFCHIKDADGNIYVVKDKEARQRLTDLENDFQNVENTANSAASTANAFSLVLQDVQQQIGNAFVAAEEANTAAGKARSRADLAYSKAESAASAAGAVDGCVKKKGAGEYSRVYAVTSAGVESAIRYSINVNSNALIQRDSEGRFKVHDPIEATHPANKRYVDALINEVNQKLGAIGDFSLEDITSLRDITVRHTTEINNMPMSWRAEYHKDKSVHGVRFASTPISLKNSVLWTVIGDTITFADGKPDGHIIYVHNNSENQCYPARIIDIGCNEYGMPENFTIEVIGHLTSGVFTAVNYYFNYEGDNIPVAYLQ